MKKLLSVFIAAFLIFSITGCTNSEENNSNSSIETSQENSTTQTSTDNTEKDKDEKVLVAYYSATGTTEKVAKSIADCTEADIFEITPVKEYTSEDLDWTNDNSRVSVEHNDPDSRNVELVTTKPENFSEYDTVFIGYPIWWGIAAWPVNNFVKENDFTGKTVIPFCTSSSSDIGESGDLLAEMAGTGEWQQGERFNSSSEADEINNWIDSLKY